MTYLYYINATYFFIAPTMCEALAAYSRDTLPRRPPVMSIVRRPVRGID